MKLRQNTYLVPGTPVAWKRPGVSGKHFYNQQTHERIGYGLYIKQQHDNQPFFTRPIDIDITFYFFKGPKSRYKTSTYVQTVPDLDNLIKHCLDSCLGILYSDDKIVVSLKASKVYSTTAEAHTRFIVTEISE